MKKAISLMMLLIFSCTDSADKVYYVKTKAPQLTPRAPASTNENTTSQIIDAAPVVTEQKPVNTDKTELKVEEEAVVNEPIKINVNETSLKVAEPEQFTVKDIVLDEEKNDIVIIVSKKPKDFNKYNRLNIEPTMFFSTFDVVDLSNNEKGKIISRSNFGLNLEWIQNWRTKKVKAALERIKNLKDLDGDKIIINSDLVSRLFINYKKYLFLNTVGSGFEGGSKDIITFGAGLSYEVLNNLKIDLEAFYGQDIYFMAFKFDEANVYGSKVSLKWDFVEINPYKLGISVGAGVRKADKVAGSYDASVGIDYRGAVSLSYENLKCEIMYEILNKNTVFFEQKQMNMMFKLGASWAF